MDSFMDLLMDGLIDQFMENGIKESFFNLLKGKVCHFPPVWVGGWLGFPL